MSYASTILVASICLLFAIFMASAVFHLVRWLVDIHNRVTALEDYIRPPIQRFPRGGSPQERTFETPDEAPWTKQEIADYWEKMRIGTPESDDD